jgi:ABC-type transporter Mla MlaB component
MLDFSALQALRLHLAEAPMPWHLHWHALKDVTPEAARELASLLADWCVQPVRLHFEGAEVLERVLRSRTPSGDRGVEKHWWRLRLDALRILRLQDEFELAALDYCVTYELSPPPWTLPRCEYVQAAGLAAPSGDAMNRPAGDDVLVQGENASAHGLDTVPVTVVELSGEVLGDAGDVLNSLQAGRRADQLTIACSRLIRVDFSAAGSILNWVSVRAAEGCEVQFTDVPRLVAAFFHVIGINEHARVVLRAR